MQTIRRNLQLFFWYVRFEAKRFVHYPLDIAAVFLVRGLSLGFICLFWYVASRSSDSPINTRSAIAYFLILYGLGAVMMFGGKLTSVANDMIKYGRITQLLIRPGNSIVMLYGQAWGEAIVFYGISFMMLILGLLISDTHLTLAQVPMLMLALINCYLLNLSFNISVGALAFFVDEARGIRNAFLHTLRVLRGDLIPLFLLPASVYTALIYSPFASMGYSPTALLQGHDIPLASVLSGSIWALLAITGSVRLWNRGIRNYEAVGL